jgi:hypothetical protein
VVLDGALTGGRDDDDLGDAGGRGLLDGVLDDRLVDERQRLFRKDFRRGEEARAVASGEDDGFADGQEILRRRVGITDAILYRCWGRRSNRYAPVEPLDGGARKPRRLT